MTQIPWYGATVTSTGRCNVPFLLSFNFSFIFHKYFLYTLYQNVRKLFTFLNTFKLWSSWHGIPRIYIIWKLWHWIFWMCVILFRHLSSFITIRSIFHFSLIIFSSLRTTWTSSILSKGQDRTESTEADPQSPMNARLFPVTKVRNVKQWSIQLVNWVLVLHNMQPQPRLT